jgi:hypothetical protein
MIIFLNVAEKITNKTSTDKKVDTGPINNLFKYFNQPFKEISWHYTSTKEINSVMVLGSVFRALVLFP